MVLTLSRIMRRTIASASSGPVPAALESKRRLCISSRSSAAMERLDRVPRPVLTP